MEALVHGATRRSSSGGNDPFSPSCGVTRSPVKQLARTHALVLVLTTITIASFAIRIHALDRESLWLDEIRTVNTFRLPFSEIPRGAATGVAQPPLESFIGAAIHRLGLSGSDWWVRLPAALFGSLSVLTLGIVLIRACPVPIALGAATFLAVCPLHVAMSQEARPYAICFFLALMTVWVFSMAWERNTPRGWVLFALVLEAFLQTRWTDPSFVMIGLVGWGAFRIVAIPHLFTTQRTMERSRLIRSTISTALAYAFYFPVFLMILGRSKGAVQPHGDHFWGRWMGQLTGSFAAMFSGSSQQIQNAATPIATAWVVSAMILCLIGLVALVCQARRDGNVRLTILLFAFVPFPIVYGAVYCAMTAVSPKVQYLLILAIPVFMGLSAGLFALATWIMPQTKRARAIFFAIMVILAACGMARFTLAHQNRLEKRDWRGVMSYLASHATPEDCFAVISADRFPSIFYNGVFARGRYGLHHADFLAINVNTPPDRLENKQWQHAGGILWILAYRDRMYTGVNETIVSKPWNQNIRILDFNGFQLIRCDGSRPASDRLVDALDHILNQLPPEKSFVAPSVFLARCFVRSGDSVRAKRAEHNALRQCLNDTERQLLTNQVLSRIGVATRSPKRLDQVERMHVGS